MVMESSHPKPRSNRSPQIDMSPRQTPPPPDPIILRSWVKSKLNVVPSTYSEYEEGMRAIKEQIQQDFFPQYHSLVMQAFYQEFYSIEVGSGEAGDKLWARWRENHRKELENSRRSSSIYSTADIEDVISNSRYPEPISFQDRRAALVIPAGISQSVDATRERQIRTSVLISEAETKLLKNRDSNYWGDLAIPVLPQATGKAKIVYIPSKSARNTVNIETQQLSDPSIGVSPLSRQEPNRSVRRNSLPALTPQSDDSSTARDIAPNILVSEKYLKTKKVKGTSREQHLSTTEVIQDAPLHPLTTPLSFQGPKSDRSSPSGTATFVDSAGNPHGDYERYFPGDTPYNVTSTFGHSKKIHLDSTENWGTETHSHSERSFSGSPNFGTFETTAKQREGRGLKPMNPPYLANNHPSPSNRTKLAIRTEDSGLGISWGEYGVPLHEVNQGHGTLGIRSPVVSFAASPTTESPAIEEGGYYQFKQPQMAKMPLEYPVFVPISSREDPPPQLHRLAENSYLSKFGDTNSHQIANENAESFDTPHQVSSREGFGCSSNDYVRQDIGVPGSEVMFRKTEVSHPLTTPQAIHTREPLRDGKPLSSLNQYQYLQRDQFLSNSAPATRDNSTATPRIEEIDEASSHPGVSQKLRSRFSFILPPKHLGFRAAAHNTRRRNSLQSNGLKVTKEVLREEEEHIAGNPNRSTFTAHVPRFGKDPMKEIHKAHAKTDAKKPAFLRAIQDAVHDGINIGKKTSSKATLSEVNALKTLKQHSKISKLTISGPMHDGNPLKMSSSPSTPNVLLNATPIPGVRHGGPTSSPNTSKPSIVLQKLPVTTALDLHGRHKPQTELMPWELKKNLIANEGFLLEDDHEDTAYTQATAQAGNLPSKSVDQPTITIDPFQQAALYSWIECSVVQACSDFLRQQQKHLNLDLLKKEVKKWKNSHLKLSTGEVRPRDQPVEFMFGMEVQCKLLEGNHRTLHFSGPSAMNAITIINAWKNIIPSFYPRTFCFPDYLILEHLRVVEKVLRLFGPAYWDSTMFEKKRAEIVKRIMEAGQSQKARSEAEKMTKLQRDRERAEASLLQAVGIWSTEESPAAVTLEVIKDGEGRC